MSYKFKPVVARILDRMKAAGVATSRGHVTEMLASTLGYGSYAALQADQDVNQFLEDIEYVLCDLVMLQFRISKGAVTAREAEGFIAALVMERDGPTWNLNEDSFFEDVEARIEEFANGELIDSDEVSAAMAETNVSHYEHVDDIEIVRPPASELYGDGPISLTATAKITGEYDPDRDRMFAGETVFATVMDLYDRITPRSFTLADRTVSAQKDDSYLENGIGD